MKRIIAIAVFVLSGLAANAQKGNIGFVYPTGAQRGTTVEVSVGGQNLSAAKEMIFSGDGITAELIPAPKGTKNKKHSKKNIGEEDNLQLADVVKFKVTIDKNASLGIRDVRLVMPNGTTNRLYFEVGELPDVLENANNELSAESASLPVTFNGQVMRSDVDRFRFRARKGQEIVARVKARVFVPYMADAVPGWFQPIVRLYGPDGKELAWCDDFRFHVDPVLVFRIPESGNYDIEINDALYRGREDFVYRIDVGEIPFITGISPLGGPAGRKSTVQLRGYNLRKSKLVLKNPKEGHIKISEQLSFDATRSSQIDSRKLQPNYFKSSAWALSAGECVENCFTEPLQQHWYRLIVSEKKFQGRIHVVSRVLGAPTDARFTIYKQNGDVLKDVDDVEDPDQPLMTHFADPDLTIRLSQGEYLLRVTESQGKAGEDYGYRLYFERAEPDFSLYMDPATFSVPAEGTGVFNVNITRRNNFIGPVELKVSGLPAGYKVKGTYLDKGIRKGLVTITAPKDAEQKTFNPKVVGYAESADGSTISKEAAPAEIMMQAFYYNHTMPMEEFRMETESRQPFRLSVVQDSRGALRLNHNNIEVPVRIHIDRDPGYNSAITLMLKCPQGNIKADAVVVPEGECEGTLMVRMKPMKRNPSDKTVTLSVQGVVKGSSKRIAGKGRHAYVAAVTAYSPGFDALIPAKAE